MEKYELNKSLAQMLKGGVIMDVTNVEQAKIAEAAGACAVMALERVPSDIRKEGGVARMSDPQMIKAIKNAVSIPVMAKVRIGHFVEAQILEAIGIDFIDESEVLTPADDLYHVDKTAFKVPFVCGCRNLGEALRRIGEGAAMIRTKGEAGTGNVVEAVRHMRQVNNDIRAREREAARGEFRRRGHSHSGRRRLDDAAGMRGRVRGLGHFQVGGTGQAGARDRAGDDVLQRSVEAGGVVRESGRGHARTGDFHFGEQVRRTGLVI